MDVIFEEEQILLDADLLQLVQLVNPDRKPYTVRPRTDNMNVWDDNEFVRRFRLSKASVRNILQQIEQQLVPRVRKRHNVEPLQQILLALRFLATGNFYISVADFGGLHKSTVARIIRNVIYAIARLRRNYLNFPSNVQSKEEVAVAFHRIARFPRVIGAVDCTHIRLQSPGGNVAETFRNRKGYFSLNVQAVCDAENHITDIVTRWPGSSHDSYIFNNSVLRMRFETGEFEDFILLGDSGYPLRKYLLTPLEHPNTAADQLYNESQIRTRNTIERTFGIWKRRFPILTTGIRTKLPLAQAIIVTTAILHNLACKNKDDLPEDYVGEINFNEAVNPVDRMDDNNAGVAVRNTLIQYFNQLL
ncbi:hypothetical protein MML48_3g00015527 [Holotrichia oblita]|uniref:Uncharacterized protein n=1 Tax=Holotrichia oblita TaxID=644536 RepID=A0ACB9TGT6_HOLOL|nr:hypothetical protein MML48_3g00015527 [Holotrichia oblita]